MSKKRKPIRSYRDLEVYQRTYKAMKQVMKEIIPKLPQSEKYDLCDQLSRSCKAVPRLIAEGYAKRHQKRGFQKYLDDAMAECNETGVGIEQARDLYPSYVDVAICKKLVEEYDISGRQLYCLSSAWRNFSDKKTDTKKPKTKQAS